MNTTPYILFCIFLLLGCGGKAPNEIQVKADKECLESFESLVDLYLYDTLVNWTVQREKWINVDPDHKLLKPATLDYDFLCEFRGIRDYGNVIVVEIKSWCTNNHRPTRIRVFERHLLLVGEWRNFELSQILWSDDERIIKEEELSERSKLIVTQK